VLLGYLVFYVCYALAGFCTLTTVTAAYLKFVPRAERTSNTTVKPKGAKNEGHMLSCRSFQWGLQAYLSLPCTCVPKRLCCAWVCRVLTSQEHKFLERPFWNL